MAEVNHKMGAVEWGVLLVLSIIWGSSFVLIEVALTGFSPVFLVFLRVFIGALSLTIILAARGVFLPRDLKLWRFFAVMGFLQCALPFYLISWGQQHVSASLASILNGGTPIFTVLLAHFFVQDEKITPAKALGVLMGLVGMVLIIGVDAVQQLDPENLGQLAILAAAFCYGLSIVWGVKVSGLKPGVVPAGMLWSASIILVPVWMLSDSPLVISLNLETAGAIVTLGVLCSAIAYLMFFFVLEKGGAANTSLVTFLIPVSTLLLAFAFLGEALSAEDIPGVILIFAGMLLVDGGAVNFVRERLAKSAR